MKLVKEIKSREWIYYNLLRNIKI